MQLVSVSSLRIYLILLFSVSLILRHIVRLSSDFSSHLNFHELTLYFIGHRLSECMDSFWISYDRHTRTILSIIGYIVHGVSTEYPRIQFSLCSLSAHIITRIVAQVFWYTLWVNNSASIFIAPWYFENYRILECYCAWVYGELCRTHITQRSERTQRCNTQTN